MNTPKKHQENTGIDPVMEETSNCMWPYKWDPTNFRIIRAQETRGYHHEPVSVPIKRPNTTFPNTIGYWDAMGEKHRISEVEEAKLLNVIAAGGKGARRAIEDLGMGTLYRVADHNKWMRWPQHLHVKKEKALMVGIGELMAAIREVEGTGVPGKAIYKRFIDRRIYNTVMDFVSSADDFGTPKPGSKVGKAAAGDDRIWNFYPAVSRFS